MKKCNVFVLAVLICLAFPRISSAMIVDLPDLGGKGYFKDISTGNIWMDVDNFLNMSFYDIEDYLLGSEFKIASKKDVQGLHDSAGNDYPKLSQAMGDSFFLGPIIAGYYGDPIGNIVFGSYLLGPEGEDGWQYDLTSMANQGVPWVGAWVVKVGPTPKVVPEVSTICMFGFGLLGAIFRRRK